MLQAYGFKACTTCCKLMPNRVYVAWGMDIKLNGVGFARRLSQEQGKKETFSIKAAVDGGRIAATGPGAHYAGLGFLGRANHWSAIIGGSHSKNYVLWEYGGYASEGVKQVAELGSPVKMEEEIRQQVSVIKIISFHLAFDMYSNVIALSSFEEDKLERPSTGTLKKKQQSSVLTQANINEANRKACMSKDKLHLFIKLLT
ncbi:Spondin-1 [Chelonia mydas]|uniref:Spondin-1 n=1 Tax=Chelonia mydas TaxID=8469 RepID=M7C8C6_CHEMY|nr:Spondin-1 [Chelonia mydas]